MFIPINPTNGVHLEYDTYNGQIIKQADVILLGYPLQYPMSPQLRYNDLIYYQQRTDKNGPAMTYAMETIAWLELGNLANAAQVWSSAWANAHDPFMVWTETPTGGTVNFITGAGGFLQGVLNGYGGIRIRENALAFNPQLPPSVNFVRFREIHYLGNRIQIAYDFADMEIINLGGGVGLTYQPIQGSSVNLYPNNPYLTVRLPFSIIPS